MYGLLIKQRQQRANKLYTSNMKFHTRCGTNIKLTDDRTVAEKRNHETWYNTSVFSAQPLGDKTFTVSIQEIEGDAVSYTLLYLSYSQIYWIISNIVILIKTMLLYILCMFYRFFIISFTFSVSYLYQIINSIVIRINIKCSLYFVDCSSSA